jgi:ATP-dependent Clp protease ATP-binding subunit ClpX
MSKVFRELIRFFARPSMGITKVQTVHCSFCGKSWKEVGPFVEGRDGAFICRSCIKLSNEILEKELTAQDRRAGSDMPPS